jgi:hypothetical protein
MCRQLLAINNVITELRVEHPDVPSVGSLCVTYMLPAAPCGSAVQPRLLLDGRSVYREEVISAGYDPNHSRGNYENCNGWFACCTTRTRRW